MEDLPRDMIRDANLKKKYICPNCRYNFTFRQGSSMALRCPNCGNENVTVDNFDINRLLDES